MSDKLWKVYGCGSCKKYLVSGNDINSSRSEPNATHCGCPNPRTTLINNELVVLCGQGQYVDNNPGNIRYRAFMNRPNYIYKIIQTQSHLANVKDFIAEECLAFFKRKGVKFLKHHNGLPIKKKQDKDRHVTEWTESDDKGTRQKVCQRLREWPTDRKRVRDNGDTVSPSSQKKKEIHPNRKELGEKIAFFLESKDNVDVIHTAADIKGVIDRPARPNQVQDLNSSSQKAIEKLLSELREECDEQTSRIKIMVQDVVENCTLYDDLDIENLKDVSALLLGLKKEMR